MKRNICSIFAVSACALSALGSAAPSSARRTPVVQAVERVSAAVVSVTVQAMVQPSEGWQWFFRDFEPQRPRVETASQGSGVIIDAAGHVLTNYHVIAVGGDIKIELADGRNLDAEVVGTAPDHDLAVLKIAGASGLPFVPMGTSNDLMIGETVIAIGNPFGLAHTVTTGVVSALHRSIQTEDRTYADFIQTDASINPGNSGGPLLNIEGALVGINTAIYGRAQGIGFAIPVDKARRIVDDLVRYGEVRRPYFGFEVQDMTAELAESFKSGQRQGVLVAEVDPKGPASGRLQPGDIVLGCEGRSVSTAQELRTRLADFNAGSSVLLDVLRDGKTTSVKLLAALLSSKEALRRVQVKIGLKVTELGQAEARRYRLPAGIILIESVARGSPAHRAGLRPGDWVRAVNSEKVFGIEAFGKAMARSYWRSQVSLLIQRGRMWQQFAFDL